MLPSELTLSVLARAIRMTVRGLCTYARLAPSLYKAPRIQVIKGKHRRITPPTPAHKQVLKSVHRFLQREIGAHPSVHSGPIGRSCFTGASMHKGAKCVIKRDVSNCYPSITSELLLASLTQLGVPRGTARVLALLGLSNNQLPQGSPLSGDLLNLYFWKSDEDIARFCAARDARYHRIADDFVVSTNSVGDAPRIEKFLDSVILDSGVKVSEKKAAEQGRQYWWQDQLVHGIRVNNRKTLLPSRQLIGKVLALASAYQRGCKVVSQNSLVHLAQRRATLVGLVHHLSQHGASPAKHVKKTICEGDLAVLVRLKGIGLLVADGKWWKHPPRKGNSIRDGSTVCELANAWADSRVAVAAV